MRSGAARASPPCEADARLGAVAQAYAERMATQHFFAHVSPDGDALPDRLEQAGYAYQTSGENLGMASGPLAAHAAIEESPGHRKNLLDPAFERVGFGLARQPGDGGSEVLLVELLATPAKAGADPVAGAYARLTAERAALKLPALQRNAALEDIATRQARAALARDDPRAPDIDRQVFGVLSEARTASADLYVARDLSALPPSRGCGSRATPWWASARCAGTRPPTGRGATGWWSSTPGSEHGGAAPLRGSTGVPRGGGLSQGLARALRWRGAASRRPRCRAQARPPWRRAGTSRR